MSQVHVHNSNMLKCFLYNIVCTSSLFGWDLQVVEHLFHPWYLKSVEDTLRGIFSHPCVGLIDDAIYITCVLRNDRVGQVITLLCIGLESNNMETFTHYVEYNENLFSPAQIEWIQEVTRAIRFLMFTLCVWNPLCYEITLFWQCNIELLSIHIWIYIYAFLNYSMLWRSLSTLHLLFLTFHFMLTWNEWNTAFSRKQYFLFCKYILSNEIIFGLKYTS